MWMTEALWDIGQQLSVSLGDVATKKLVSDTLFKKELKIQKSRFGGDDGCIHCRTE